MAEFSESGDFYYKELKNRVTPEYLKKTTIDIIASYKRKDFRRLRYYLPGDESSHDISAQKLFSLAVRRFHPDRYVFIHKKADELMEKSDSEGLARLAALYLPSGSPGESQAEPVVFEESFSYSASDFGYAEQAASDIKDDDLYFEEDEEDDGISFFEALHRYFVGGLDIDLSDADLLNLDGEIDLSDYGINSLEGLEKCPYISALNLSGNGIIRTGPIAELIELESLYISDNRIENIDPLGGLKNLKELDISFNMIEDISVLENMPFLEYVSIIGNPVTDYGPVRRLMERGVLVVVEDGLLS